MEEISELENSFFKLLILLIVLESFEVISKFSISVILFFSFSTVFSLILFVLVFEFINCFSFSKIGCSTCAKDFFVLLSFDKFMFRSIKFELQELISTLLLISFIFFKFSVFLYK